MRRSDENESRELSSVLFHPKDPRHFILILMQETNAYMQ